jgi:hypothetical protein
LAGLGGIGTCLSASGLCRFASLLLQQPRFHEYKYEKMLMESCFLKIKVTDEFQWQSMYLEKIM